MHCEVIVNGVDLRKLLMSRRFKKDLDGGEKMQNASAETILTHSVEAKCNLLRDASHHPSLWKAEIEKPSYLKRLKWQMSWLNCPTNKDALSMTTVCRSGNAGVCHVLSYLLPARFSEQEDLRRFQRWDCFSLPARPTFLARQHTHKIK